MIFGAIDPEEGTLRVTVRFAFLPALLDDGRWVWLGRYHRMERWFDASWFSGVGWGTIKRWVE